MKKYKVDQRTPEWFFLRKGKITGTGLKSLMGTAYAKDEYFYEILAERLSTGVDEEEYENAMDRGNRLEPDAIAQFEFQTNKTVERVGFVEGDDAMMANSPDGYIGETEAIEAKCLGGKNHVKMWLKNEIPAEYYWQVIQYFVVNPKLQTVYFVGYNPDIAMHPLHIIEVPREAVGEDIAKATKAQEEFIIKVEDKLKELVKL